LSYGGGTVEIILRNWSSHILVYML